MKTFTILLLFCSVCSYGQIVIFPTFFRVEVPESPSWAKGKITLEDGTELTGLVRYDRAAGEIGFSYSTLVKQFNWRELSGFEFFDLTTNETRAFIILEVSEEIRNGTIPVFEVLRAYENFAVLFHRQRYEADKSTSAGKFAATSHQRETILFLPAGGKPIVYLEFLKDFTAIYQLGEERIKFKNKDVFKRCTGSVYPAIKAFAKKNSLSFRDKNDLLRMLDFYGQEIAKK